MTKLSDIVEGPPPGSGTSSSVEVTELKAKVTTLEAKVKAIPETIVVSSVNDLPDPSQYKSGSAARVLSNGQEYIATGAKDSTATTWES